RAATSAGPARPVSARPASNAAVAPVRRRAELIDGNAQLTSAVRLSPSASVLPTDVGVLLRTDLGTFQLEGDDVRVFVSRLVPLLDGTRSVEDITATLSDYSADSVHALLDVLRQYGLVVDATGEDEATSQDAFYRKLGADPRVARERLRSAHVTVVG